jgi:hypothetical protein
MSYVRGLVSITALLCIVLPAQASFQAADLVVVPFATHADDTSSGTWRTDLFITNVDEEAIDVAIYYFPGGVGSNRQMFVRRDFGLGGRESEEYHYIDERLADIPPNGTVHLVAPLGDYWYEELGSLISRGAFAIFAFEAGTDGATMRNIVVTSRTYATTTIFVEDPDNEGQYLEETATWGQFYPGVPWYNWADGGFVEMSSQVLTGGVGGTEPSDFHYNIGIFNTSDPQTSISVTIEAFDMNGEPYPDANGDPIFAVQAIDLLAHVQITDVLQSMNIESGEQVMFKVSLSSWQTNSPSPIPTFVTYGMIIDASSNDATPVLPSFKVPYDVECMWSSATDKKLRAGSLDEAIRLRRQLERRPLQLPPR